MPRKVTAHGAPSLALVSEPSEQAPVVERKRARRTRTVVKAQPKPVPVEIDLTRVDAKKALAAAYPREVPDTEIDATEKEELAALAYIEARDAEARAQGVKEASANVLRYALKTNAMIKGKGWKATWKKEKGDVDWSALTKELKIEDNVIERFRKEGPRVLRVTETAE